MELIPAGGHGRTAAGGGHPPAPPRGEAITSRFAHPRAVALARAAESLSLKNDPVWQKNWDRLFERSKIESPGRIFGGVKAGEGEFPHCVAIGSAGQFCCTGTVVGPNVVVTAGHCVAGGCAGRVFVGLDSNRPETGRVIKVKQAVRHPQYSPTTLANDVAVLILAEDVPNTVTPCKIATAKDVEAAYFLRLAGYGFTETGEFGVQCKVDVAVASAGCTEEGVPGKYGCHAGKEVVAGGEGLDSCNGDSGGPAYVVRDLEDGKVELLLAGATSRATSNSVNNCGDGGIYVRIDQYEKWVRETAEARGGKIP